MTIKRDKFDFDIGYFIKSPCRDCEKKDLLPKCADECDLLDDIQTLLAEGISCCYSSIETLD